MPVSFKPNTLIAELRTGRKKPGESVRVAGRLFNPTRNGFELVDGEERLTVSLKAIRGDLPTEAAWVGVEGEWHQKIGQLKNARLQFVRETRVPITELINQGYPEAAFVADPARLTPIRARAVLLKWMRAFLDDLGFLEVQTPMLQSTPEVAYLKQYRTKTINGRALYLRTDPEDYLKRYLSAGFVAVYEISTNVRGEWPSDISLQEFTSMECYRRFWTFDDALSLCSGLVTGALDTFRGRFKTLLRGQPIDLEPPLAVRSFGDLALEHTGLRLSDYPSVEDLSEVIRTKGWWDGTGSQLDRFRRTWLEWLLDNRIIPNIEKPMFVIDFPVELGISYREHADHPSICLRGELYLPGGFELAHVYENLTDPEPLRARYEDRLEYRVAAGLPAVPLDEGLVQSAVIGIPPMAGMALGVDRLLLLLLGNGAIGEGLLFPREGFPREV